MKRVNFAWQEFWYGFDSEQEAQNFINKNWDKPGWIFLKENGAFIYRINADIGEYEVRVRKPIKNYNTGW